MNMICPCRVLYPTNHNALLHLNPFHRYAFVLFNDAGTHSVWYGTVVEVESGDTGLPLLYYERNYRTLHLP